VTGCFPWKSKDGLYNTCLCLNREGEIIGQYNKSRLFDAMGYRESDLVKAGDEMCIVDFDFGRVGIAVCYELRFPEYLRQICNHGVDLLCIPAAFYVPRHDDWEILTKAAALQNLTYVCAVNQYNRFYCGRSSIINPNGVVLAEALDCEMAAYGEMDLDLVKEMRGNFCTFSEGFEPVSEK
jgi:predicted amidohydrolase